MKKITLPFILLIILVVFIGCSAQSNDVKNAIATVQPTNTYKPVNTPSPTITPVVTVSAVTSEAHDKDNKLPEAASDLPLSFSGDSPTVLDDITLGDWIYRATLIYTGNSYVMIYDNSDLEITSIDAFNGSFPLSGNKTHSIEIDANGPWELVISPVQITDTMDFSGNGYAVSDLFIGDSSLSGVYSLTHEGDGSFLVMLYASGQSPKLVVSKIGEYSGKTQIAFNDGKTYIWEIQASDGDWEIKRER